ncbi:diguanylate cyclase response regulator [Hahella sp. CCB-MM4]|uniref:diguanylate cyclase n=1 Tax=Hahella sp. (strain CCB-MM4) TaxID=1926491 RepID=UPI000B9B9726|nr:diguanylate cyclase [Hahella sp. CCB-MM4]OZG74440.1 diguanylate cyclase response regulator [Hahella sp. CCB-MM4]
MTEMFPDHVELEVEKRRGRILIVDDQPLMIRVIHQIFADEHELFMATSGEQALEFCQNNLPDLVLLDVVMPGMDGLETCRRLKKDERTASIPVIFVTGQTTEEEENECWDAGCVDFVNKPVNARTLLKRVRSHLTLKFQSDLLRRLAMLDGLTKLANRRYFDQFLSQEWRRCKRAGKPLSLVLLDIDHFKSYNDSLGHQQGDDSLRMVASAIARKAHRPADLAARYGGEEFAVILPETDLPGAVNIGEQIEQSVRELQIEHPSSPVCNVLTVSIGVASMVPVESSNPELLIKVADQHLYLAKNRGRGQVCAEDNTSS